MGAPGHATWLFFADLLPAPLREGLAGADDVGGQLVPDPAAGRHGTTAMYGRLLRPWLRKASLAGIRLGIPYYPLASPRAMISTPQYILADNHGTVA